MYRIWIGIFGFHLGSFLLCMCHGYLRKRYTLRSQCDACHHVLHWYDLIPILSYVWLKGRCHYCGKKLSKEYILAEILTGFLCMCIVWNIDIFKWDVIIRILLFAMLWCVCYIDYLIMEIPNEIHIGMIILFIIHACMMNEINIQPWIRMLVIFRRIWMMLSSACFLAVLWMAICKKKCIAFGPFLSISFLLVFCGYFDSLRWGL